MKYLYLGLIALFLFSCSEKGQDSDNSKGEEVDATHDTKEAPKENEERVIYTAVGIGDGMFGQVYITPEDERTRTVPDFDVLHVIPSNVDTDGLWRNMNTIIEDHFGLFDVFEEFTGDVVMFYDKEKRHKAATFSTQLGNVHGIATVYTPKGRILAKREYFKGRWVKNIQSPGCADWHYNQSKSNLTINDLKNGRSKVAGVEVISLIPSLQESARFDDILDKSSYVRPFKVNDKNFTGKLLAYTWTTHQEDFKRFELNFKNGTLHGDVKVYSDLFGLTLHEVFDDGNLAEKVFAINWEEMGDVAKPIIYFYPEETTELTVKLDFKGELTHTYPKYQNEWKVTAHPNGTLYDEAGQEYYALYWEGENDQPFSLNEGNIVKGENTVAFLEKSLATLGLNRREANEFIMYWLPKMENNAYNLVHFSTDEYEKMAQLSIDPQPETMIRVMMVFQPLDSPIAIPEQDLEALRKERQGFTVVEWGGKEVHRTTIF